MWADSAPVLRWEWRKAGRRQSSWTPLQIWETSIRRTEGKNRSRPCHQRRKWAYSHYVYFVDRDFTDEILQVANQVIPEIGGEIRSVCIGHTPSELRTKSGKTVGGGNRYGHVRFAVPEP